MSPDGRVLEVWWACPEPSVGDVPLQWWSVRTKKQLKNYDFNTAPPTHRYQTIKDLKGIVTEDSFDIQNIKTGKIIRRFEKPNQYNSDNWRWTFSPDGKTLWWADEQQRIFWQFIE